MPTASGTPKHWRERAREARAIAGRMRDLQARCSMLENAERYERNAQRAEAKLRHHAPGIAPALPARSQGKVELS